MMPPTGDHHSRKRLAAPNGKHLKKSVSLTADGAARALLEPHDAARRLQAFEVDSFIGAQCHFDPVHRGATRAIDHVRLEPEGANFVAPPAHAADLAEHAERYEVAAVAVRDHVRVGDATLANLRENFVRFIHRWNRLDVDPV